MTEETFHAALRDDPLDELTWSALADFLDDVGQADRAELLRLTRRMAMIPLAERGDMPGRVDALIHAGVKPVVVQREGALGMRFSLVMPGHFLMGSPEDEEGRAKNEKQHEVTLTRPFWMGVTLVTQAQWKEVRGKNPSHFKSGGSGEEVVKGIKTDAFPVECVTWKKAQFFLKQLNEDKGREKEWEYSLPTESQWEYACRGGVCPAEPYHFGNTISKHVANYNDRLKRTSKVRSYPANAIGLYDMHGNVWEWCADWFGDYPEGESIDPIGPPKGLHRVGRGGSWNHPARDCRSATRIGVHPENGSYTLGFRVALVPSVETNHRRT